MSNVGQIQGGAFIGAQVDRFSLGDGTQVWQKGMMPLGASDPIATAKRSRLADEVARIDLLTGKAEDILMRLSYIVDTIDGLSPASDGTEKLAASDTAGHLSRMAGNIDAMGLLLKRIDEQVSRLRGLVG